jgi:hypothetical protein
VKSHTEYLWFNTKKQREFINITRVAPTLLSMSATQRNSATHGLRPVPWAGRIHIRQCMRHPCWVASAHEERINHEIAH